MKTPKGFTNVALNLPDELAAAIEAWRAAQVVPPTKNRTFCYFLGRGLQAAHEDKVTPLRPAAGRKKQPIKGIKHG